MLIQFSVENFLSFDKEQVFSMAATNGGQQHPAHLVADEDNKGGAVLRAAAIYGPNASGKSNLIQAMRFAQRLIVDGTRSNRSLGVKPFKLGAKAEEAPSKFEFLIRSKGVLYNYGFQLDSKRILQEWLFATLNKQEVLYFQRLTSDEGKVDVEFGPTFAGRSSKQKQFLHFVAQGTRPNQLFLTESVERNVTKVLPLIDWFRSVLVVISAETQDQSLELRAHTSTSFTDFLAAVLKSAGTGIEAILTEEVEFDFDKQLPGMPGEFRDEVMDHVLKLRKNGSVVIEIGGGKRFILRKGPQGQPVLVLLKMQHRTKDGRLVTFNMEEESEGTQRLIHMIPALFSMKERQERVIVLDEIDRRFHTHLTRMFLQVALDCDKHHTHSQLIFTTHDTNLLDLELLRRDEIWFVEKDNGGASHVYALAEYNTRPDLKIEKGYLNGRFGAIPFITNVRELGWITKEEQAQELESEIDNASESTGKAV